MFIFYQSCFFSSPDPILPDIIRNLENGTEQELGDVASDNINSNGKYGYLVAAKGATQFVCNPFVGLIVGRSVPHLIIFSSQAPVSPPVPPSASCSDGIGPWFGRMHLIRFSLYGP